MFRSPPFPETIPAGALAEPPGFTVLSGNVLGFFSSRLADVALRLGPYMSISSQKDICTRTQEVHQSWQIKINQKNTRPANPPARFAFRQEKTANQTKKRGKAQTKKQPQQRFAKGHSGFTTVRLVTYLDLLAQVQTLHRFRSLKISSKTF